MNENLATRAKVNKLAVIYTCWESENQVSPVKWQQVYQPLQRRPHVQESLTNI